MNRQIFFLAMACTMALLSCNNPKVFTSPVNTTKTPWTNLQFNNNPENFQFAIISDRNGGNRPGVFDDGIKKLNLMQPEFVINVGDLLAGYTTDTVQIKKEWDEVNGIISTLTMPFFYVPGNHDITNNVMEVAWEKRFGSRYYSFVYKNRLFVVMDSNDDNEFNLTRKQTDYVLNSLQTNSKVRWTFLFVHHPIWKYNTDGRFEEIEKALAGKQFTMVAGHEHHYHQTERNGSNFYILATTGAGSGLRGNYMGEFDHISWVTMADQGPVIANLRLDGILPHNISNDQTDKLAKPMLQNSEFKNVVLCNKGENMTNGTCYFSFVNPSASKLKIHLGFFHHNQLKLEKPDQTVILDAGTSQIFEVPFGSVIPLSYSMIDPLRFEWEMQYMDPELPGFSMQGKSSITIIPTETAFIDKETNLFIGKETIRYDHPFSNLESVLQMNNLPEEKYKNPIEISTDTKLSFFLRNSKNEYSLVENRKFSLTDYQEPRTVPDLQPGLKYSYYEGEWSSFPDFAKLTPKGNGVAGNLMVQDLAKRNENWGMVFSGYIKVPADNLYSYRIMADDGCRFFINDKIVIDEITRIKGEMAGSVALKKGYHTVRIEFLEKKSRPRLRVFTRSKGNDEWKAIDFTTLSH